MNTTDSREFLIDIASEDCYSYEMLRICFHDDDCIDKKLLLSFLRKRITKAGIPQADKNRVLSFVEKIDGDETEYIVFLHILKKRIVQKLLDSSGDQLRDDDFDSLSSVLFWPMVVVAMKKCLGRGNSRAVISDTNLYYSFIPMQLNRSQKGTHDNCIEIFSHDADKYSVDEFKELRVFLHSFGSKNKKRKTRKKNLNRVVKRVHRVMQINKISHHNLPGNIFSEGRYLVPKQFADCLKKMFLN